MELTEKRPTRRDWRQWSSTRRGTLTIAAISALLAAAILLIALSQYRHNANAKSAPATVLVATQLIEKGTSGDAIGVERMFRPVKVLDKQISGGAIADPGALYGTVAATDIYPGQQLTSADFVSGGGIISRLASSQRAVSVPVDSGAGMIGEIHSSDHVDVYASFKRTPEGVVHLLAPNVVVLKAAQESGGSLGSSGSAKGNVVLEVNTRQAAELAYTAENGKVWLVLRPGNGNAPGHETVTEASILGEAFSPTGK
jgi:Flp pilus assembly protein CpaB